MSGSMHLKFDDKIDQSWENVSTKVAPEGLHNPKKLG
jgi:hypothetical protein